MRRSFCSIYWSFSQTSNFYVTLQGTGVAFQIRSKFILIQIQHCVGQSFFNLLDYISLRYLQVRSSDQQNDHFVRTKHNDFVLV